MVIILMMSGKIATFWDKDYDVIISVRESPTKFYHLTQIILSMWSCDQILVTLAFL